MARTGMTWTKFEEIRGVTIAGWRDTLREIAGRKPRAKGKDVGDKSTPVDEDDADSRERESEKDDEVGGVCGSSGTWRSWRTRK